MTRWQGAGVHELSLCTALVRQLEGLARGRGACSIKAVTLTVGPLGGVDTGLMRSAFPFAAEGSLAAGAELTIVDSPLRIRCLVCGHEGAAASPGRLECQACGCPRTQLLGGDELHITQVMFS